MLHSAVNVDNWGQRLQGTVEQTGACASSQSPRGLLGKLLSLAWIVKATVLYTKTQESPERVDRTAGHEGHVLCGVSS